MPVCQLSPDDLRVGHPTPFGLLDTVHLKPRDIKDRGNVLTAEIWFAPQLRYLPVRIRIEQDPATYVDLVIVRRPEIAAQ